jgi:hypothetical protein
MRTLRCGPTMRTKGPTVPRCVDQDASTKGPTMRAMRDASTTRCVTKGPTMRAMRDASTTRCVDQGSYDA